LGARTGSVASGRKSGKSTHLACLAGRAISLARKSLKRALSSHAFRSPLRASPFVPSKDPIQRFEDILSNIAMIEAFTAGMNLEGFAADLKTSKAVERCLERISEAAKKLEGQAETLCPEIP